MGAKLVRSAVCCLLVFTIVLASCNGNTEDEATNGETSKSTEQGETWWQYEKSDCLFAVPQDREVECGWLTVPEDRSQPDGNKIKLHVAIFRTKNSSPESDPIVYLAGGPGEHALESASLIFDRKFAPLTENRDIIIFDQRGTGYSDPALECPGLTEMAYETLDQDIDSEESIKMESEATLECYECLKEQDINLSAYNSAESAADLNDLRLALGYDEWNLFGISYGTRLALTAMRDYPEGIRSVILNSTCPVQANLYTEIPAAFDRALNVLFDNCASDPAANKAYPELEKVFYETIAILDDSPAVFDAIHPLTGETYEVLMNGDNFFNFVISMLYSTEVIPLIPKIIFDTKDGKYDTMALMVGSNLLNMELRSTGMYYSVQCNEELPFSTPEDFSEALDDYPEIKDFVEDSLGVFLINICSYWTETTPDPVENEPVYSDIPVLILAGEYDPITPPYWGEMAAETLSGSYFFLFPGLSHDVLLSGNECPVNIALEFLDNPWEEPDRTGLLQIETADFVLLDVNLVPFTSTLFGVKGVCPENWTEVATGTYTRSDLGITAISQQVVPGIDVESLLNMISGILGLEEIPERKSVRTANGLDWSIYEAEAQGVITDIAVAEGKDTGYVILFTCVPDDHAYYYLNLLVPAIDALTRVE